MLLQLGRGEGKSARPVQEGESLQIIPNTQSNFSKR